jgi:hypothetical protein
VGTGSPNIEDEATFIAFLRDRNTLTPALPTQSMPSFPSTAISDAAARDIFAYIRTFKLDKPDVQDAPAMKSILDLARQPAKCGPRETCKGYRN